MPQGKWARQQGQEYKEQLEVFPQGLIPSPRTVTPLEPPMGDSGAPMAPMAAPMDSAAMAVPMDSVGMADLAWAECMV